ncbi:MAG: hypothetical protein FWB86_06520 [Treponema sp.]|nr:hypothetical protein [Treponema sp.]MCL2250874.1 hypothetical protein [Treponema sp.]
MKKRVFFVLVLFSIIAITGVFAFSPNNGTFGASGTSYSIKFWTDGNIEMTVDGTVYRLCGKWIHRNGIIIISFNNRAPEGVTNTQQELTVIDNNTLRDNLDGVTWRRR